MTNRSFAFRPHLLLFALQFVLDAAEVSAELLLEFVHGIGVALRLCLGDFAPEEKLPPALAREATQIGVFSLSPCVVWWKAETPPSRLG